MRALVLALSALVAACGGKILVEPADGVSGGAAPPSAPASSSDPAPAPSTLSTTAVTGEDACAILCERDARCDTTLPAIPVAPGDRHADCGSRCRERLHGKCGVDDWLLCYAAHVTPDACAPLPDDCRPSFCAWAKCAWQPVSDCE